MKAKTLILSMCLLLIAFNTAAWADTLIVRHVRGESEEDARFVNKIGLLKLALLKTEKTYGPFELQKTETKMQQRRALISLAQGIYLDIVWTMTSNEREKELLPIRIPLQKGLLGHRTKI
jgi:hypothetical protein